MDTLTTIQQITDTLPKMRRHAYYWTGCNDKASDLLQDCWIQATAKAHTFKGGNLPGWLFRVMYSIFLNQNRKAYTRRTCALAEDFDVPVDGFDTQEIDSALQTARLSNAVADYRYLSIYAQGHTLREVAEITGRPIGSIKSGIHMERKIFRKNYNREGFRIRAK